MTNAKRRDWYFVVGWIWGCDARRVNSLEQQHGCLRLIVSVQVTVEAPNDGGHIPPWLSELCSPRLCSPSQAWAHPSQRGWAYLEGFFPREFRCQMEYKISPSTLLMAGLLFQRASSTLHQDGNLPRCFDDNPLFFVRILHKHLYRRLGHHSMTPTFKK